MRGRCAGFLKVLLALAVVCSLLVVAAPVSSVHAEDGVRYVSVTGSDSGSGSKTNPWRTIQHAIDQVSSDNCSIWVAEGTYHENVVMNKRVSLYGGYSPEPGWTYRNRITTIDGGNAGIALSVPAGVASGIVIVIDDFAITNGTRGIYAEDGTTTISHNDIYGNAVGIFLNSSSSVPDVENNSVHDNNGPGVVIDNGNARLYKNEVWSNQGDGISVSGDGRASMEISSNTIRDNSGDGIYAEGYVHSLNNEIYGNAVGMFLNNASSSTVAEKNSIHGNNGPGVTTNGSATLSQNEIWANQGAGISVVGSGGPAIRDNTIRDNSGDGVHTDLEAGQARVWDNIILLNLGCGLYIHIRDKSSPTTGFVLNNVVAANKAGGIIYMGGGPTTRIANNTVADNLGGPGIGIYYSNYTLTNNIAWGNAPRDVYSENIVGSVVATYSDIGFGDFAGTGNIQLDPRFMDPANHNYHLESNSPCIDKGTQSGGSATDLEGRTRPIDGNCDGDARTDMGAYEHPFTEFSVTTNPVTNVTFTSATLNGHLDSLFWESSVLSSALVSFQVGLTTSYDPEIPIQTMTVPGYFSFDDISLAPGTTYHYRAVATASDNVVYGDDMTFTTTTPVLSLSPDYGPWNTSVNITGSVFPPGVSVSIYWDPGAIPLATATTETTGTFSTMFVVPAKPPGVYVIRADVCGVTYATTTFYIGEWQSVGNNLDDKSVHVLRIDPQDENTWYAGTDHGLYITRNGGTKWDRCCDTLGQPISGKVTAIAVDPNNHDRVCFNSMADLYESNDQGRTSSLVLSSEDPINPGTCIESILISRIDGSIFVGIGGTPGENARKAVLCKSRTSDPGDGWEISFDNTTDPLDPEAFWHIRDIAEGPVSDNGTLYFCTEVQDTLEHDNPIMRSTDHGQSWVKVSDTHTNNPHGFKISVDPVTRAVYYLSENNILYKSADFGASWESHGVPFCTDLLIDQNYPNRIYGGEAVSGSKQGGVYFSDDAGESFRLIGLKGAAMGPGTLALNGTSTRLFAAVRGDGIYAMDITNAGIRATFPDSSLEAAVREAIVKPYGPVYTSDLANLTGLEASGRSIHDLSGLEWCTSLVGLVLENNQIDDISPLANLTNLVNLRLWNNNVHDISPLSNLSSLRFLATSQNQIEDLSPLAGLANLQWLTASSNRISNLQSLSGLTSLTILDLADNQIADISQLSGLAGLWWLFLQGNQIRDISPLSSLTSLTTLYLSGNQISDLSPLSGLTSLTYLYLNSNQISDIKSLVNNPGIGPGDYVHLEGNPLNSSSINTWIPALEWRGVNVYWDTANQAPDQPSNSAPSDGAGNISLAPTLSSSAFSDPDVGDTHGASQWQITAASRDYTSPVFDSRTDSTNLLSILVPAGKLSYSTTYYWHVRHQDNHGDWSSWSAETSFSTMSAPNRIPNQPRNVSPANGATGLSLTPTLQSSVFSDPDPGDTHGASQWQITSTSGDYSSPAFDSGVDTANLTSIAMPSGTLNYSTTYYWHVRHQDNHGAWSEWSEETSITTNTPPVAANDSYRINQNTTLSVPARGVLTNDRDVESPSLTAVLQTTTSHGSLTLDANGSFIYTPYANFNGTDTFTYRAYDGEAYSNTAKVTITVNPVPNAPRPISVSPSKVAQGQKATVTITGSNFTGATAVSFGPGIKLSSFKVNSAKQITANIAIDLLADPGPRNVSVTTSVGTGILINGFTVVQVPPTVTSVSPTHGARGQQNIIVTISGTNFVGATAVSLGAGINVNSFTVISSTQIVANISISIRAKLGRRDVSVTTSSGTGTLRGGFVVA